MSADRQPADELRDLLWSIEDGSIEVGGIDRIDELVREDERLLRQYIEYTRLMSDLRFGPTSVRAHHVLARLFGVGEGLEPRDKRIQESDSEIRDFESPAPDSEPLAPPIVLDLSPTSRYPLSTNFVGGPVFSYLVATVILGMMLLGAWAYKITHYQQIAEAPASVPSSERPELVFVGRITGMADCRWANPSTAAYAGASVPLGRKYALSSGLIEITYTTGAKVILQGPCTYEVESRAGGYLSLGKLTAKIVERGGRSEEGAKPQAANLQISNPNPQPLTPNPLFAIRTPTAIVTDLGTEFGVEVEQDGNTISHVFRGSVKVQVMGGTGLASDTLREEVVLRENELAWVEKRDGKPTLSRRAAAGDSGFVLAMPPPKSVRDSEGYAELVLSLSPVVYYRMEKQKNEGGTAGPPSSGDHNDRTLPDKPAVPPTRLVFDSAPGGHHGELRLGNEFGAPYVPGRFGDALWLRGPAVCDRVVVPDYPKATDDQLTVSAWVLATGRPGWAMIVGNWGRSGKGQTGQFSLGLYKRDGDLCGCMRQRDAQMVQVREGASQPLPLFAWQHVALVADGATLHLYRNGKEVTSRPYTGILLKPTLVGLCVGCRLNNEQDSDPEQDTTVFNDWWYWQGRVDELVVFNRPLPPETIQALYLGKRPPKKTEATTKNTKGGQPMNGP